MSGCGEAAGWRGKNFVPGFEQLGEEIRAATDPNGMFGSYSQFGSGDGDFQKSIRLDLHPG